MARRGRPKANVKPITRERIAEARDCKGWSNMELSRQLGVDVSAVRKWINSDLPIPPYHLENISKLCDVPLDWLKGESIPDIIQESMDILKNFNPEKEIDYAPQLSEQAEMESLTLIYALKMCGYEISDINDKNQFAEYMTKSIRSMIETYISTLN